MKFMLIMKKDFFHYYYYYYVGATYRVFLACCFSNGSAINLTISPNALDFSSFRLCLAGMKTICPVRFQCLFSAHPNHAGSCEGSF